MSQETVPYDGKKGGYSWRGRFIRRDELFAMFDVVVDPLGPEVERVFYTAYKEVMTGPFSAQVFGLQLLEYMRSGALPVIIFKAYSRRHFKRFHPNAPAVV